MKAESCGVISAEGNKEKGELPMKTKRFPLFALSLILVLLAAAAASEDEVSRYRMLWGCPSCGNPGNVGGYCGSCGAARPYTRPNLLPNAQPANEPAGTWTCPQCGRTGNQNNYCPICGTARPESAPVPTAIRPVPTAAPWSGNQGTARILPGFDCASAGKLRDACLSVMYGQMPDRWENLQVKIDFEELIRIGERMLETNSAVWMPASAAGDWRISVTCDGQAQVYDGTVYSVGAHYHLRNVSHVNIGRDGVGYDFYYQDGALISISAVVSQSTRVDDYEMIRYADAYTYWDYLSSMFYGGQRVAYRYGYSPLPQGTPQQYCVDAAYDCYTGVWFE